MLRVKYKSWGAMKEQNTVVGIYPGSFDPLTVGHLDIIKRASKLVSKLIIAIGNNPTKSSFLTSEEKVSTIKAALVEHQLLDSIEVHTFDGLLVDFAHSQKAKVIFRGLRAFSDFDFEFNLAASNQALNPGIESVFLMTSVTKQFISSRLVKEVFLLGGDISPFVPAAVLDLLNKKRQ